MPITLTEEAAANLMANFRRAVRFHCRRERSFWQCCGLWAALLTLVLSGCAGPSVTDQAISACREQGGVPLIAYEKGWANYDGCGPPPPAPQPCPPARFRPDYFEQPAPPAEERP